MNFSWFQKRSIKDFFMKSTKHIFTFALFTLFLNTNMQAVQTRSQTKKEEARKQEKASTKIQSLFRGHKGRKIFKILKKLSRLSDGERLETSCPICCYEYDPKREKKILLCCGKGLCKECIGNLKQIDCPFCRQVPIKFLDQNDKTIISLPFILHIDSVTIPYSTYLLPFDLFFQMEEIEDIAEQLSTIKQYLVEEKKINPSSKEVIKILQEKVNVLFNELITKKTNN